MATDPTAWFDEREREAKTLVSMGDAIGESAEFRAAWSPDTAMRVLRALRAAVKVEGMCDHAPDCDIDVAVQPTCTCGMDELRDALDALPGAKHG